MAEPTRIGDAGVGIQLGPTPDVPAEAKIFFGIDPKRVSTLNCKHCPKRAAVMLDEDGVRCSISGKPGMWAHSAEDGWWPCEDKAAPAQLREFKTAMLEVRVDCLERAGDKLADAASAVTFESHNGPADLDFLRLLEANKNWVTERNPHD